MFFIGCNRKRGNSVKIQNRCLTDSVAFFIYKFICFNWRLITLQYYSSFCHTLAWIGHGCTRVPHPEPLSNLLPIPSLRVIPVHQPWASCFMHWTWTGDLSQMVIYMFQCYSLKSSHPCFSHRVQKSVLYICVSFAVSHIGTLLPSF